MAFIIQNNVIKSYSRFRTLHSTPSVHVDASKFVVCGAGAGGLAIAARLCRKFGEGQVSIVDPAEVTNEQSQYNCYTNNPSLADPENS